MITALKLGGVSGTLRREVVWIGVEYSRFALFMNLSFLFSISKRRKPNAGAERIGISKQLFPG
jgi:hypothetical protein